MKVTSIGFKRRMEFAQVSLVRMSAPRLTDDTKTRKMWAVPLKVSPGTASIAECLAAKSLAAGR